MKIRPLVWLIIVAVSLPSCNRNRCESDTENWRNGARQALKEFKGVDDEIRDHDGVFSHKTSPDGKLFLRTDDTVRFENEYHVQLPKLKAWFSSNDWGFISYDQQTISVNYKNCVWRRWSYSAYLYYSPMGITPGFTKHLIAEIRDSISLGENWYFIRTRCNGCGE